jgi:hypothetical protein
MKIVVAQFYSENVVYGSFAKEINERYCNLQGYTYFAETNTEKIKDKLQGRSWTWYKPHLIKDVFIQHPDCSHVLFLDIDAVFSTENRRIEEFIDVESDIVMTSDYGPSLVNAGVMLVKNTDWSKNFMDDWWNICEEFPQYKTGLWHDQTCIGFLYQRIDRSKFKIIDSSDLNSKDYDESKFIFHAFAYGMLPYRTIDSIYNRKFNITTNIDMGLNELAKHHGTDKFYHHNYYTRVYENLFRPYKKSCDILEIGVYFGSSIKVWDDFFESGIVHGIDVEPKSLDYGRIQCFVVDQSNEESLKQFSDLGYQYDIIVDDGSHKMKDQQITVQLLFKNLKSGGTFVIEDLQTSIECRMPSKVIFGWGDPNKTTFLDMIDSIIAGSPKSDYITSEWDYFISNISEVWISKDRGDSIIATIKKK